MSLKCFFGLAVCLNYHGSWISDEDVRVMKNLCSQVSVVSAGSFINTGENRAGADLAEELDGLGLEFSWSRNRTIPGHKLTAMNKRELSRACGELRNIANGQRNWSE